MTYKIPAHLGIYKNSIIGQFPKVEYSEFTTKCSTVFENIAIANMKILVTYSEISILDPRGFTLEITNSSLNHIMNNCTVIDGVIIDECIYVCSSNSYVKNIIKVGTQEYNDAVVISTNISIDPNTIPKYSKIVFSDGKSGYLIIANGKSISSITHNRRTKPSVVYALVNSTDLSISAKSIVSYDDTDKCRYVSKIDTSKYIDCSIHKQMKITYGNITTVYTENSAPIEMSKNIPYYAYVLPNKDIIIECRKSGVKHSVTPNAEAIIDLTLNKKHNNCIITPITLTTPIAHSHTIYFYQVYIEITNIEIT